MRNFVFSFFVIHTLTFGRPLTLAEKKADLEYLVNTIESNYGPYDYKKLRGIDPRKLLEKYSLEAATTTNKGFYYLINRFIAEFQDSHFSSAVDTDLFATLGFVTDRVEGKALIDEIDRSVLSESAFPFQRGDEVLALGGVATETVVADLAKYRGMGFSDSALRTATVALGFRAGSVMQVPTGKTVVRIRHGLSSVVDEVELTWNVTGKNPPWESRARLESNSSDVSNRNTSRRDLRDLSIEDIYETLPRTERTFRCSGKTRIQIPKDAVILSQDPFVAYYHPTAKGNVGYLRIPHYNWGDDNAKRFRQYEFIISQLEAKTVGLVIDQDHNCGGAVNLVEDMVGLFAAKPFLGLQFQFLASHSEYNEFKSWKQSDMTPGTLEEKYFNEMLDLMKAAWEKGERLTPKTTFQNAQLHEPNSVRYTKPVLMLIDEMSGSGGDAFPAMMQGIGRAKLFGKRTMGAGGHVEMIPGLPYATNKVRITKSLFYHPNGAAIENNGVSPNIPYTITRDDFLYGYRDYQKAYLSALLAMI